ncbi:MAG: PAS domain-containing protein [Proteobacteria bacterium]|nr:PAS domain-containing protein [Pseudomonadota bacterium]
MLAKSIGQEKSEELIQETAAKFRLRNKESYTLVQATLILEEITKLPGTIGISARFIKTRLTDELRQIESFLTDVINSMPSLLIILDSQLKITRWNKIAQEEAKVRFKDAEGKLIFDIFPYLSSYQKGLEQAISERKSHAVDKISWSSNEQVRHFKMVIYPLSDDVFPGVVLRLDDITSQIKLETKVTENDKLASLGVLTAGIAHEINNPVNFVLTSITPLKNDITDVLEVLDRFENVRKTSSLPILQEIGQFIQSIDLPYSIQEIHNLLKTMGEGATRIAQIVKDLRVFSRLDEADMKKVDLHECIDSTITLLHHEFKNKVRIHKEYSPIPLVECFPGKLNQVFMNLLANAIQAIKQDGDITVKTAHLNDTIQIHIQDTGCGIPDEIVGRIFEPFFTTKPVGSGTGLGLSISYRIIEEHKGTIEVKSQLNVGTEFIITLPISQFETAA